MTCPVSASHDLKFHRSGRKRVQPPDASKSAERQKYRAERRAAGKDAHPAPRTTRSRTLTADGHIPRSWFREHIGKPALDSNRPS